MLRTYPMLRVFSNIFLIVEDLQHNKIYLHEKRSAYSSLYSKNGHKNSSASNRQKNKNTPT